MEERRTRQCPPPPAAYPWLVFSHGRGFKDQTFHTIPHPPPSGQNKNKNNNNSSTVRSVPELRNKFVWNSCHGWLILSNNDDEDQFSLFNPVTLESVLLPPNKLDPKTAILGCTLTFPPSNPNCTLFVFDRGLRRILFCRLENKKWIAKSYAKEIDTKSGRKHDTDFLHLPVCCKGKLYASISNKSQLVSIDTVEQDSSHHLVIKRLGAELPSDYEQISPCVRTYLVESNGEIYCIIAMYGATRFTDVNGIEIFKLDLTRLIWERVESLKDGVFFMCNKYAVSCPAICTDQVGEGTCVYFTQVKDKSLYAYNIADDSISVSLPCPSLPTPWKSPIWVMSDLR